MAAPLAVADTALQDEIRKLARLSIERMVSIGGPSAATPPAPGVDPGE